MHGRPRAHLTFVLIAGLLLATSTPWQRPVVALPSEAPPVRLALGVSGGERKDLFVLAASPVAECRDLTNPDRAIAACTTVNASKNLARRTRAVALSNRCAAYQTKGALDKAIADCTRAIEHDPASLDALYNRGRARRKKGDLAGAVADYTQGMALAARSTIVKAKLYNNRGDAFAELGDTDRALSDFGEAIQLDPQYAKALLNRGAVRSRRGELDAAIGDYTQAFRLDSSLSRALAARGNAYLRKKDFERARSDYAEALRIDPADSETRANLDRIRVHSETSSGAGMELGRERVQGE